MRDRLARTTTELTPPAGYPTATAISADGSTIAVGLIDPFSGTTTLWRWNRITGVERLTDAGPSNPDDGIALSKDGQFAANLIYGPLGDGTWATQLVQHGPDTSISISSWLDLVVSQSPPAISDDGQIVSFAGNFGGDGRRSLILIGPGGTETIGGVHGDRQFPHGILLDPTTAITSVSGDGRCIAFPIQDATEQHAGIAVLDRTTSTMSTWWLPDGVNSDGTALRCPALHLQLDQAGNAVYFGSDLHTLDTDAWPTPIGFFGYFAYGIYRLDLNRPTGQIDRCPRIAVFGRPSTGHFHPFALARSAGAVLTEDFDTWTTTDTNEGGVDLYVMRLPAAPPSVGN